MNLRNDNNPALAKVIDWFMQYNSYIDAALAQLQIALY